MPIFSFIFYNTYKIEKTQMPQMDTNNHSSRMKQILSQIIRIFFRQENYLRDLRKKIRG